MNKNTPIDFELVESLIVESGIESIGKASIRELVRLVSEIEIKSGKRFIRMEMGVPGLDAPQIGVQAEIEALNKGVASIYPAIEGLPELKFEISEFVRLFLDIKVNPISCIPTVGSMMGGFAAFLVANRVEPDRQSTLYIDPGFPVQKLQSRVLAQEFESFDIYNYRDDKLKDKLNSYLRKGNISTILYSNPNNPSWICLTEDELKTIAGLAEKYNVIVIEDLAYFGMDFRKDLSRPGKPPFQSTIAKYTDNYLLLISSSKAFSYAGQRIGMMVVSDKLFNTRYPNLRRYYGTDVFGRAMIYGALYALSSGTSHSAQYALASILRAVNSGQYNFIGEVKEYGEKARIMKEIFTRGGFEIVYRKDIDRDIADGFYFTISYPGFSGPALLEELLYYGISAISLTITGSERHEGIRACVSQVSRDQFDDLRKRVDQFKADHPL